MIAAIWEVYNDRHGDLNKSQDVLIRCALLLIETLILHFIFGKPLFDCFLLSVAVFTFVFDYAIGYVLIKNKVVEPRRGTSYSWFTYTAKKGFFDNIPLWKKANPWVKFAIKLSFLIIAVVVFVIL